METKVLGLPNSGAFRVNQIFEAALLSKKVGGERDRVLNVLHSHKPMSKLQSLIEQRTLFNCIKNVSIPYKLTTCKV